MLIISTVSQLRHILVALVVSVATLGLRVQYYAYIRESVGPYDCLKKSSRADYDDDNDD